MLMFSSKQNNAFRQLTIEHAALKARSDLLDSACGVGLWEAIMHQGDAMHPQSRWTWSPEFRRLIGYAGEAEFPNVVQSWSDRLHPDDVVPTFAAFTGHLADKSGRSRYDVMYRLKVRDGSYRWFRATGGCAHHADGSTITACGSLTDIHVQKTAEMQAAQEAEADAYAIQALGRGLEAIVSGDLGYRIKEQLSPKLDRLKTNFNQAVAALSHTLQAVVQTAQTVGSGSQEISASTEDLSKRTEQQAASLEETAAALDEITATVKKTAEGARHAQQVVSTAKADAEHSGNVVGQAVEAMNAIEQSSKQVSQIIGVIDEIAFQTNLLALNAGVEAARAGEAGRGFAVVASEVRALAQRSAEAAKEIKTLISASGQQVEHGVALVGETGTSLARIVTHVAEINGIVSDIATSAHEQAAGLDQVNTAVNQMDQVTQQNAAMVEESTAASHSLAQDTQELTRLVGRFHLGDAVAPLSAAKPRQAQRRAAPVRAMKTLGTGGAARKPEASATEASWEEF